MCDKDRKIIVWFFLFIGEIGINIFIGEIYSVSCALPISYRLDVYVFMYGQSSVRGRLLVHLFTLHVLV